MYVLKSTFTFLLKNRPAVIRSGEDADYFFGGDQIRDKIFDSKLFTTNQVFNELFKDYIKAHHHNPDALASSGPNQLY